MPIFMFEEYYSWENKREKESVARTHPLRIVKFLRAVLLSMDRLQTFFLRTVNGSESELTEYFEYLDLTLESHIKDNFVANLWSQFKTEGEKKRKKNTIKR